LCGLSARIQSTSKGRGKKVDRGKWIEERGKIVCHSCGSRNPEKLKMKNDR